MCGCTRGSPMARAWCLTICQTETRVSGRPERESSRNTGQTLARCADVARAAGGTVIATAQIYDRMEAMADAGAPNFALAEYKAPDNHPSADCPMCKAGTPIASF